MVTKARILRTSSPESDWQSGSNLLTQHTTLFLLCHVRLCILGLYSVCSLKAAQQSSTASIRLSMFRSKPELHNCMQMEVHARRSLQQQRHVRTNTTNCNSASYVRDRGIKGLRVASKIFNIRHFAWHRRCAGWRCKVASFWWAPHRGKLPFALSMQIEHARTSQSFSDTRLMSYEMETRRVTESTAEWRPVVAPHNE